jgi:outer membrane protein TolC
VSSLAARANEIAQIADASYREGATSLLELIEAQRARSESRAAAARWAVEVRLSLIELKRATGTPLVEVM